MGKIRTRNSGKRRNPGSVNISFPYSANSENQVLIVTILIVNTERGTQRAFEAEKILSMGRNGAERK